MVIVACLVEAKRNREHAEDAMGANLVCHLNDPAYASLIQYGLLATVTGLACARVAGLGQKAGQYHQIAESR